MFRGANLRKIFVSLANLLRSFAKSSFPVLVIDYRLVKLLLAEVGPEHVGEVKFGVRNLPQQEVADPHLAARAYQELGVGDLGCVEMVGNVFFGERIDVKGSAAYFFKSDFAALTIS